MTFYQELQLNAAGSKALIRGAKTAGEKARHTAVYIFKVFLTVAFCVAFVLAYSSVFGSDNSIVGVVVLLCVMVFRNVDLGMHVPHSLFSLGAIFLILTAGPKLANVCGPFGGLAVNLVCIWILMVLGCHNILYYNHSTLLLGYLLLYGYDASGHGYAMRVAAMALGYVLTGAVFWRNHRHREYKRGLKEVLKDFDLHSSRSRWQLLMAAGVSTVMFIAVFLKMPRAVWAGIAAMSVMLPFREDIKKRVRGRIWGNLLGGALFLAVYTLFPDSLRGLIGIVGGIGVGFSAAYGWQAVFNSMGAMSIAVGLLGVPGAIFFRIFYNVFGSLYALLFEKLFHRMMDRMLNMEAAA